MLVFMSDTMKVAKSPGLILSSVIFILASSFSGWSEPVSSASCIDLKQPSTVRFEGLLIYKVFAGPPNFIDVRRGDKPEPAYILRLSKPICVSRDDFIDPRRRIDRV
jgi:hypothetical protein